MFLNKLVIERSDIVLLGAPLVETPHECHVDVLEPVRRDTNGGTVSSLFTLLVVLIRSIFIFLGVFF